METSKPEKQPVLKKQYTLSLSSTIIAVAIVIGFSGGSYYVGYKMGQKRGAELIVEKVGEALNPLNAISDNYLIPNSTNGRFVNVDGSNITIKQANGEKTYELSENLQVTKQGETITINDLQPDQNITVFTNKKDDSKVHRIIAR